MKQLYTFFINRVMLRVQFNKTTMKLLFVGIIAQLLFWSYVAPMVGAEPIKNLRNRELHGKSVSHPDPIPCIPGTSGNDCICPGKCLSYYNSTGGCHPNNCWKWNEVKEECEEAGKEFMPAIILQGIPVTGVFGSGFGNMGRWDIFGTYMGIVFGGCAFVCLCGCIAAVAHVDKEGPNEDGFGKLAIQCSSCLWSITITIMWIWGIVIIANKEIDAPWTDWHGDAIMCPLVG